MAEEETVQSELGGSTIIGEGSILGLRNYEGGELQKSLQGIMRRQLLLGIAGLAISATIIVDGIRNRNTNEIQFGIQTGIVGGLNLFMFGWSVALDRSIVKHTLKDEELDYAIEMLLIERVKDYLLLSSGTLGSASLMNLANGISGIVQGFDISDVLVLFPSIVNTYFAARSVNILRRIRRRFQDEGWEDGLLVRTITQETSDSTDD